MSKTKFDTKFDAEFAAIPSLQHPALQKQQPQACKFVMGFLPQKAVLALAFMKV